MLNDFKGEISRLSQSHSRSRRRRLPSRCAGGWKLRASEWGNYKWQDWITLLQKVPVLWDKERWVTQKEDTNNVIDQTVSVTMLRGCVWLTMLLYVTRKTRNICCICLIGVLELSNLTLLLGPQKVGWVCWCPTDSPKTLTCQTKIYPTPKRWTMGTSSKHNPEFTSKQWRCTRPLTKREQHKIEDEEHKV